MALYMIKANIRQAGVIRHIQEQVIYSSLNFLIYLIYFDGQDESRGQQQQNI